MYLENVVITNETMAQVVPAVTIIETGDFLGRILYSQLILSIFFIVLYYKLFKKAGQPSWTALIPFYSNIVLSKTLGIDISFYLLILITTILGYFIPFLSGITIIISILVGIAYLLWTIVISFKLARKFNKGIGLAFGFVTLFVTIYILM